MKAIYKLFLFALLCLSVSHTFAQTDTTATDDDPDTLDVKKGHVKIGVSYDNNSVYLGRTDISTKAGYSASLNYTAKFGGYISGAADFIPGRQSGKLDGGNLELGYDHSFGNFDAGASFTKLFYNSNSTQISSSLSSILTAYVDYNIADIITPAVTFSYNIDKTDIGSDILLNPNISHDFAIEGIFGDNDYLLISPEAGLNAGTQNYFIGYLDKKQILVARKRATAAQTTLFNSYYNALDEFKILDYEITVPIIYKTGHFRFSFIPTYAFAQDTLPYGTVFEQQKTDQIQASSPYKSSVFYFSLGVALKF